MNGTEFDRWFLACDPYDQWAVWLARHDEDPRPECFAYLAQNGSIITEGPWPLSPEELGAALTALHTKHLERMNPRLRHAREAQA